MKHAYRKIDGAVVNHELKTQTLEEYQNKLRALSLFDKAVARL